MSLCRYFVFATILVALLQQASSALNDYPYIDIPIVFHVFYNPLETLPSELPKYSAFVDSVAKVTKDFGGQHPNAHDNSLWEDVIGDMKLTFFIDNIIFIEYDGTCLAGDSELTDENGGLIDQRVLSDIKKVNIYVGALCGRGNATKKRIRLWIKKWQKVSDGKMPDTWWIVLAHELAHFFSVRHIGQKCDAEDYVDDTPHQDEENCDNCGSNVRNNCGDYYMMENIMAPEVCSCVSFFTKGQAKRVRDYLIDGNAFISEETDPAAQRFINMVYFVSMNDDCIVSDSKQSIYSNAADGEYALCIRYSKNRYANVFTDIQIFPGGDECLDGFFKIDTKWDDDAPDYYICGKKGSQSDPLSAATITDLVITDGVAKKATIESPCIDGDTCGFTVKNKEENCYLDIGTRVQDSATTILFWNCDGKATIFKWYGGSIGTFDGSWFIAYDAIDASMDKTDAKLMAINEDQVFRMSVTSKYLKVYMEEISKWWVLGIGQSSASFNCKRENGEVVSKAFKVKVFQSTDDRYKIKISDQQ